jgi:hypothetical protein
MFFTEIEKAWWRNIQMSIHVLSSSYLVGTDGCIEVGDWTTSTSGKQPTSYDEVYTLPGPAKWWKMVPGYNEKKAGFYLPQGSPSDFQRFTYLVMNCKSRPNDNSWESFDPLDKELRLVCPDIFS